MIIVTLGSGATAERVHIPAESQFTMTTSDRDMEKLHHEAAIEYRSAKGMGVTQIIKLQELVISKFETNLERIKNTAGKFLDNLLEIYPGTHNCKHAKSKQICEDRKETAMLLWHQAIVEYGNLKIGLQRICSTETTTIHIEIIMHNLDKNRAPTDIIAFKEIGFMETNIHDSNITGIQDLFRKRANNKSQRYKTYSRKIKKEQEGNKQGTPTKQKTNKK